MYYVHAGLKFGSGGQLAMSDHLYPEVDLQQREPSCSPSPTPSSSPGNSSGYEPGSSDTSPGPSRVTRKKCTPHTSGPRESEADSSSSEEMNLSTGSKYQKFHMDEPDESLLISVIKPLNEMCSDTCTNELVLETKPSQQESQNQEYYKRLEAENKQPREKISQLKSENRQLQEKKLERQPLEPINPNCVTNSKKQAKGQTRNRCVDQENVK